VGKKFPHVVGVTGAPLSNAKGSDARGAELLWKSEEDLGSRP